MLIVVEGRMETCEWKTEELGPRAEKGEGGCRAGVAEVQRNLIRPALPSQAELKRKEGQCHFAGAGVLPEGGRDRATICVAFVRPR